MDDKPETADSRRDGRATPLYLVPDMGKTPVAEPAIYRSLFILDTVENYLAARPSEGKPQGGQPGANQPGGGEQVPLGRASC